MLARDLARHRVVDRDLGGLHREDERALIGVHPLGLADHGEAVTVREIRRRARRVCGGRARSSHSEHDDKADE